MTSELALLVNWSVRQKLNRVSSFQFSYVVLCGPLGFCFGSLRFWSSRGRLGRVLVT